MAQRGLGGSRPQRIGVVDAVAAGQCRVDQRHGLVAHVGVPGSVSQIDVVVEQLPQAEVLGQRGRQDEPGVGHQSLVVEGHRDGVEAVG